MPEKSTTDEKESHPHLCDKCGKRFECTDPEDKDFEFARCPECKAKKQSKPN